jgi:hypothetical protein
MPIRRSLWTAVVLLSLSCAKPGVDPGLDLPASGVDAGHGGSKGKTDGGTHRDGGTHPGTVDAGASCFGRSCSDVAGTCGPIADGCGGQIECGHCPMGASCGGGGKPSQCGTGSTCLARTCAEAGANCGPIPDGCGGVVQCGGCKSGAKCGGGDVPSVCTGTNPPACVGLCQQEVTCPGTSTTTISGIVHAPTPAKFGAADPLYDVLVYIPNGQVMAFSPTVSCDRCDTATSGSPLLEVATDATGHFRLSNVPVGRNIPLVIQLGHWRRQVVIPNVYACVENKLPDELTRLPRNHNEGDIPLMAMVTGSADSLECVLRKIGIDDSEFTTPSGGGRVQLYNGGGVDAAQGGAPAMSALISATTLSQYSMVLFACQGSEVAQTPADQMTLINYANAGGRVFATHFSYVWLFNDAPFSGTAKWNVGQTDPPSPMTATVNQSFPRGAAFAQWLQSVGASSTLGQVPIQDARHDFDAVLPPAQEWLASSSQPLHYTFNTPLGVPAAMQCGRALYSDFHVASSSTFGGNNFPTECDNSPMSAQEKVLEFMMFDLSSCVPTGGGSILK